MFSSSGQHALTNFQSTHSRCFNYGDLINKWDLKAQTGLLGFESISSHTQHYATLLLVQGVHRAKQCHHNSNACDNASTLPRPLSLLLFLEALGFYQTSCRAFLFPAARPHPDRAAVYFPPPLPPRFLSLLLLPQGSFRVALAAGLIPSHMSLQQIRLMLI